jgi:hypothetical protein
MMPPLDSTRSRQLSMGGIASPILEPHAPAAAPQVQQRVHKRFSKNCFVRVCPPQSGEHLLTRSAFVPGDSELTCEEASVCPFTERQNLDLLGARGYLPVFWPASKLTSVPGSGSLDGRSRPKKRERRCTALGARIKPVALLSF